MGISGSDSLGEMSEVIESALQQQWERLFSPGKRKSDRPLRRFTIREMAEICFRMKLNTLRHHLKTIEGLPEGTMQSGNRKTYSLEEVFEIQKILRDAGKIPDEMWPHKLDGERCAKIMTMNLKGGVSKTSTVANLSQLMAVRGYRVCVVDLDPQGSCTDLFDVKQHIDRLPSIYDVIKYSEDVSPRVAITDAVHGTYFPNIDIIPASLDLTEFEYETAKAAREGAPFYRRISEALQAIEDDYDVILFDTPPHMSFCVIAALFAANGMIIPLQAEMLDIVSLVKFLDLASNTLHQLEEAEPHNPKTYDFIRILLTKYKSNDGVQIDLNAFLRNTLGDTVTRTNFLSSIAISDGVTTMQPLLEVEPSAINRKTYDRIMESLQGIAIEIEEEIMVMRGRLARSEEAA